MRLVTTKETTGTTNTATRTAQVTALMERWKRVTNRSLPPPARQQAEAEAPPGDPEPARLVGRVGGVTAAVVGIDLTEEGRIGRIWLMMHPDKLHAWRNRDGG